MPSLKKGQKELRVVVEEGSEIETTLQEWARKRGLTPAKATRCILADWTDAINGKTNPFALAIAATTGINLSTNNSGSIVQDKEPELSPEERQRQQALLDSMDQFM